MAASVRFTPRALADLDDILAHIARDSPPAGARLISRIEARCMSLADLPERGVAVRPGFRRLVYGKYLIFYRLLPASGAAVERVQIARILHGARDLPASLRPK